MVKICPECLNLTFDADSCNTCGFPFNKSVLGDFENMAFYNTIDLFNAGKIDLAKGKIANNQDEKLKVKMSLLNEKILLAENIIIQAAEYAKMASSSFESENYLQAQNEIYKAIQLNKLPIYFTIESKINNAIEITKTRENAQNEYKFSKSFFQKNASEEGLNHLKKAIELYPDNEKYQQEYTIQKNNHVNNVIEKVKSLIAEKNYILAEDYLTIAISNLEWNNELNQLNEQLLKLKQKKKSRKNIFIGIVLVLFITSVILLVLYFDGAAKEKNKWEQVKQQGTIQAFLSYIEEYNQGRYSQEAKSALSKLQDKDNQLWANVFTTKSRNEAEIYLSEMNSKGGRFVDSANIIIDSLDWFAIVNNSDRASFQNYLNQHPHGYYLKSAINRMSMTVSNSEKDDLINYVNRFFLTIQSKDLDNVILYFSPITRVFGSRKNLPKTSVREIFENDQKTTSLSRFIIDSSTFKVTKDESGNFNLRFYCDNYLTRVHSELNNNGGNLTSNDTTYFSNMFWTLVLDINLKIIVYKYRIISEAPIIQNQSEINSNGNNNPSVSDELISSQDEETKVGGAIKLDAVKK